MADETLPVTKMFSELVRLGYITPPTRMEEMAFPGAYPSLPTIIGYTTPDSPVHLGMQEDAELGQRAQRDLHSSSNQARVGSR